MKIKIVLFFLLVGLIVAGFLVFRPGSFSNSLQSSNLPAKKILPSETLIDYTDPTGFTFSYPDNLSITKKDTDTNTYADVQLSSKDVNGSLSLKIEDSKFVTLDKWVKLNKSASVGDPKEVKLGNLKSVEIKTGDRLLLGALDQGIFFTIEMPRVEEDFWDKVYQKTLKSFSFAPPATSEGEVSFEGEEVVE